MAWQPAARRRLYRLGIITLVLALIGVGALGIATTSAGAESTLDMTGLDVADVNRTVSGDVSDVTLSVDLSYSHEVPDATRRVIKIQVGPDKDSLTTLDYINEQDMAGTDSGTVTLSGSILDAQGLTASEIDPALASTNETQVVVQAEIEITRSNGETVTETVTDTATLRLTDGGNLTASIGGSGEFTVETSG